MEYLSYQDAFDALVQENDGVLPDLYEDTDITISGNAPKLAVRLTVADIVAQAIIEMSVALLAKPTEQPVATKPPRAPVAIGKSLRFDKLLGRAAVSLN